MAQKMERFTQRARRVLNLAQEEAERLEHGQIDTEHLLLGLFLEDGGVGAGFYAILVLNLIVLKNWLRG